MIKKTLAVLLASASLAVTACAQDAEQDAQSPAQPAASETAATAETSGGFTAPDSDWRDTDPENTLYIDTQYGRMVIELYPEMAPGHVERIKTLTRQSFYDYISFHRVIEDFMNQTGDPKGDGTGDSDLPDLEQEFLFRRSPDMGVTLIGTRSVDPRSPDQGQFGVGFLKAMPVATQPSSQAILTKDGKVKAFGLHCKGVTSMARSDNPNSANSQFFLMRGEAAHLDAGYTTWGTTIWGRDVLTSIKVGTKSENPDFVPDVMEKVQVEADVAEADRVNVEVLKTDSPSFQRYLQTLKNDDGTYPDICDIDVPTRLAPAAQ